MPSIQPETVARQFLKQFPDRILTIDSHTAGEPTRLVVGGLPPIPGETINDKRLYLSEHTVKYHIGAIMQRLHLKNRSQVLAYAARSGLLKKTR